MIQPIRNPNTIFKHDLGMLAFYFNSTDIKHYDLVEMYKLERRLNVFAEKI